MTRLLFILTTVLALAACTKKENFPAPLPSPTEEAPEANGIVGTWLLTEQLFDPGDGSGTFQPVSSNRYIKLLTNGSYETNSSLCDMVATTTNITTGTYNTTDQTFNVGNCWNASLPLRYMQSGNELILMYPCIEPCQLKYIRQVGN